MFADPDQSTAPCPPANGDALPTPRCGPKELWQAAQKRGAPDKQLATIEYLRTPAGPAWRFDMPGTPVHFVLYGDCGRELLGAEATGSVP
jgi:hypothetical protein